MLRRGGEISNFTTRITPRYWPWTTSCGLLDWTDGVRGCANRTSVIAPKQNKTAIRRRNLKNADWEADFFFIGWEFGLSGSFADTLESVSTWISQWWNALVSESGRACQHNFDSFWASAHPT
jgi:hypothetical protein